MNHRHEKKENPPEMDVLRYTAFTTDPGGGNPAGVVLDATGADDTTMQSVAADVGYSETAFLIPQDGDSVVARYFSPMIEVPFCGHATIAAAVAHAQHHGASTLHLQTRAGAVTVATRRCADGSVVATLTSVPPSTKPIGDRDLAELLDSIVWSIDDLDPALPPRAAYAGAWHPVIAAATRERLADLAYDMPRLNALMQRNDWATIDLVWRESPTVFHARNPFPPGGVVEDPATGAAAAALGGYLREFGLIALPAAVRIYQGYDMGRPSTIDVTISEVPGSGIEVTGSAVLLEV
jgi:PhzF family phenazine biosynthesis protein